jgi:hypothetical protein
MDKCGFAAPVSILHKTNSACGVGNLHLPLVKSSVLLGSIPTFDA